MSDDVELQYENQYVPARRGERLLDALLRAGIAHRHICGGRGFCTSCRVEVIRHGFTPVSALERQRLGRDAGRLRLACQARVERAAAVRVPPASRRFRPDD